MHTTQTFSSRFFAGTFFCLPLILSAQTWTGAGANDDFSNGANWNGGAVPANDGTADVTLAGTTRLSPALNGSYALNSLSISSASVFTLGGSGSLTINSALSTVPGGASNQYVNVPIVLPGRVQLETNTPFLYLKGLISGAGGLDVTGSGRLVLGTDNTYAGTTNVSSSFGLMLGYYGNPAGGGWVGGDIAMSGGGNVSVNRSTDYTYTHAISGGSGNYVSLNGFGSQNAVITFTGANTYTGTTQIYNGITLKIGATNTLATGGSVLLQSNGLLWVAENQTLAGLAGNFGGHVLIDAGKSVTVNVASSSFGGNTMNVTGDGKMIKTGAGTYSLSGGSLGQTGGVLVNEGTFSVQGATAISGPIENNATLRFDPFTSNSYAGVISGTGAVQKYGSGSTMTLSGANTYTGTTSVVFGTLVLAGDNRLVTNAVVNLSSGTTLDVQGNHTLRDLSGNGSTVTVSAGKTLTGDFSSSKTVSILTGEGSFVKTGAGSVTLTTLTVAGGTTISQGSVSTTNLSGNVLNNGALTISNASNLTYADVISGSGNLSKSGTGTLTLTNANTFGGTLTLISGRVVAAAANALSSGTVMMANGAQLEVSANQTISGFVATGSSSVIQIGTGASLTVNTSASNNLTALLSGSGTFVKRGSGNLSLNNPSANTFDGQLQVQGGMLRIAGSYTSADVAVSAGGQLRGTGFIQDIAVGMGGEISAGATLGTGTFTMSSLTLAGGSHWVVDVMNASGPAGTLNGGWDLLSISGALDFNASEANRVILDLQSLSAANVMGTAANFLDTSSYAWLIASAGGGFTDFSSTYFTVDTADFANGFSGSFNVSQIGNDLFLNYTAGTSAVPEPSTYAMIAGAGALALAGLRRRNTVAIAQSF